MNKYSYKGLIDKVSDKEFNQDDIQKGVLRIVKERQIVKLELICAYTFGNKGSVELVTTGRYRDGDYRRTATRKSLVVGYRLKNIDTKTLRYVKTKYDDEDLQFQVKEANPGEEFIITRDDLKYLMLQNGSKLQNATILSNHKILYRKTIRPFPKNFKGIELSKFDYEPYVDDYMKYYTGLPHLDNYMKYYRGLPYLRFNGSGKKIRDNQISIAKYDQTTQQWKVLPEYEEYFYWIHLGYIQTTNRKYNDQLESDKF